MPRLLKPENYVVIQGWMITELDLKGNELLIYAIIYGFTQSENQVFSGSLQYLADWTNLSKRNVIERLKSLVDKGFIIKTEKLVNNVKSCEYRAAIITTSDETSLGDETSPNNKDIYNISNIPNISIIPKNTKNTKNTKESKNTEKEDIHSVIIDYLNKQCGKRFRVSNVSTRRLISARLAEGNKLDDFKRVIDTKVKAWKNDKRMKQYLRPETLFADSHFESYLNEGGETNGTAWQDSQPTEHGVGWNKILKPFDPKVLEEKAKRDCEMLNREKGTLHLADGYTCLKCDNRGYMYVPNGAYIARQNCECAKPRATLRRMIDSGLKDVITRYTFGRYNAQDDWQKHIKAAAESFAKDPKSDWFFIGGESGAGKSHICTAICRELLRNKEVRYMLWEEEANYLKSVKMDSDLYQPRIRLLQEVEVLYIDDFLSRQNGVSEPSEADITFARELFNRRYFSSRTTIISTEWYSSEILALDKGLGGRIIECCGDYMFNIGRDPKKNYRLRKAGTTL